VALIRLLSFLPARRFSRAAAFGLVARLVLGFTIACRMSAARRSRAASRFCDCSRYSRLSISSTPSLVTLLAASVIFVGIVASALGSRLTHPIRNLTDIADHISRGELGAEITEVHRSDEIGGLAKAIDRLKASVAVAMKRLGDARASGGTAGTALTHGR